MSQLAQAKRQEHFQARLSRLTGGEFECVGKYLNDDVFTNLRHTTCGHVFSETPGRFQDTIVCPYCAD